MNKIVFLLLFTLVQSSHAMQQPIEAKSPSASPTPDSTNWLNQINVDFRTFKTKTRTYSLQASHQDNYPKSHARLIEKLKVAPDADSNIPDQFVHGYKRKLDCCNFKEAIANITYTIALPTKHSLIPQEKLRGGFVVILSDLKVVSAPPYYPDTDLKAFLIYAALQDAWSINPNKNEPMIVVIGDKSMTITFVNLMGLDKKEKESGTTNYPVTDFDKFVINRGPKIMDRMRSHAGMDSFHESFMRSCNVGDEEEEESI